MLIQGVGDIDFINRLKFNKSLATVAKVQQPRSVQGSPAYDLRDEKNRESLGKNENESTGTITQEHFAVDRFREVPWDHIVDHPAELTNGWSYLQETRELFGFDSEIWLYEHIWSTEHLRREFLEIFRTETACPDLCHSRHPLLLLGSPLGTCLDPLRFRTLAKDWSLLPDPLSL